MSERSAVPDSLRHTDPQQGSPATASSASADASPHAPSHAPPLASIAHGGNLHEAAARYRIPYEDWLDLSTGINPHGYPVPPVPADAWRRLPDEGDGLAECAAHYYGAPDAAHVLPVAGSQAAIRALPALLPRAQVGIAPLTYSEYAPAFERAGHRRVALDISWDVLPEALTHVIVVNPNNPTAEHLSAAKLLAWHAQLSERGGTLLVDEAFVDTVPAASLAAHTNREGLIVLRSPGKFFGLAGVRAGFVLASPAVLQSLRLTLGAWTVSGPARHAVKAAFADHAWQQQMRSRLAADSARLVALLQAHGIRPRATPLFAWTDDARAAALHEALATRGVWTRLFAATGSVRFGLPESEAEWARLQDSLRAAMETIDAAGAR
ncbi:threonine-phosphate decarboxylase CobD [Paraburkholderia phenoliruptrix]|uniref:threonine-phosphate decarboxylase n=1 Tax=Paraburkholderia phenoliruptrix BR3459a TaxID=1229205 RepID=K0DNA0_9BURK|nr:threonine-phosphate decarboxylase CobD [Paraburkholderia phenoliruptrix]AFT84924.1 cobalamin biosynthetic protein CobC [Paraburkholderia phenoliruptrix BR3459a]